MDKTALILIAVLLLLAVFAIETFSVKPVSANPKPYYPPALTILSPVQNGTYSPNVPLTLDLSLTPKYQGWEKPVNLSYCLDEKAVVALDLRDKDSESNLYFSDVLSGLSDGVHNLLVQGITDWQNLFNSTVTFTVDSNLQAQDNKPPKITVTFPENKSYLSYGQITLNFSVNGPFLWARYSIDNQANTTTIHDHIVLSLISPGGHSLTVYAVDSSGNVGASNTVEFYTVYRSDNENLPSPINPIVSIVNPQNASYNVDKIPLIFTLNEPVILANQLPAFPDIAWIFYSLDGQANKTVTGNTTISGLTSGAHNVTVYAEDIYGNNGSSQTIFFTINPSFPTAAVIGILATALVVGAVTAVYFRKRKPAYT
jgi:hypothetical protein